MNQKPLVAILVLLVLLGSSPLTQGNSSGVYNQSSGCGCHSQSGTPAATVTMTGQPTQYTAGATSTLSISVSNGISGNNGGFSLEVDKGTLSSGIGFAVNVNSAQNSATHSITGSSQRSWSVDWIAPSTGSGIATLSLAGLTANGANGNSGDRWATLSYQIPEAGGAPNNAPDVSNVLLGPTGATTSSTLTLAYTYTDQENDPESGTQVQWFKDDVEQTSLQGLSVSPSATSKGQEWKAIVTPSDGSDSGTPMTSNTLIIANEIPTLTTPEIQPSTPSTDDALSFTSTTSDADFDAVHFDVRWFLDGVLVSELNDMETLPAYVTRDGDSWVVEVRANDSEDTSQWLSSSSVSIGGGVTNTAPTVTAIVLTPVPSTTTDDISLAYTYNDADADAEVDVEVMWNLNNVPFQYAENSMTLPSSFTEKGQTWFANVRVYDGTEWSSWSSSDSIQIQNTAPITETVSLSHSQATTSESITVEYTMSDIDGDTESNSEITWWRNGIKKSSLTGLTTLPSSSTLKGEVWTVIVQAGDGTDVSATPLSANVTVVNSAPTASLTLSENVTALGPLNLQILTDDADSDTVETNISWYRNGFLDGSLSGQTTVPTQLLGPGQTWAAHVTPFDTEPAFGSTVIVSTTILNIEPVAQIQVLTNTIWEGEWVTLSAAQSQDADGQIVEATWSWIDSDGITGSESGFEINMIPFLNTVVTLTVYDDMDALATANIQLSPTEGPVVSEFLVDSSGTSVLLEWSWNGPNATFNVLRNGVSIGTTDSQSFSDNPLFAGESTYSIQPVVDDMPLVAGTSPSQTIVLEPAVADAPGPSSVSGLVSGIVFLLIGLSACGFAMMERRD
tara:strand:+ start:4013 stop:6550 length:2538 start_codon:yes stop_codon:yes gene_type:complete